MTEGYILAARDLVTCGGILCALPGCSSRTIATAKTAWHHDHMPALHAPCKLHARTDVLLAFVSSTHAVCAGNSRAARGDLV